MILRRRGMGEEVTTPTPTYDIHTVTTRCTNTTACANYFKALGYTGCNGFIWIRGNAQSITNNHILFLSLNGQNNLTVVRRRNNANNTTSFGTSYDGIIEVGDKFLVAHFAYNNQIDIPTNTGISVSTYTSANNYTNASSISATLTSNHFYICKLPTKLHDYAYGTLASVQRFNGQSTVINVANNSSYEVFLEQGDELWDIVWDGSV